MTAHNRTATVSIRDIAASSSATQHIENVGNTTIFEGGVHHHHTSSDIEQLRRHFVRDLFSTEPKITNPEDDRDRLIREKGDRVDKTCEWIGEHGLYRSWLSNGGVLWISGGPGLGKTMMSIYLTQILAAQGPLLFFFCRNDDTRCNSTLAVLRSLIFNLQQRTPVGDVALKDYDVQKADLFSNIEALWRILEALLKHTAAPVYCVIDGIDECKDENLGSFLHKLQSLSKEHLRLVLISREKPDLIEFALHNVPRIRLDPDQRDKVHRDIDRYIAFAVEDLATRKSYSGDLKEVIRSQLAEKAEGTFLWVSLVAKELREYTASEAVETMKRIPKGLPAIYERIILQIPRDRRAEAVNVLRWIMTLFEPLNIAQLSYALQVQQQPGTTMAQSYRDLLNLCGNILKIDEDNVVTLVHQSARDYLSRSDKSHDIKLEYFRFKQDESHFVLAKRCLEVVKEAAVAHKHISSSLGGFTQYSISQWPNHAANASNEILKLFEDSFFNKGNDSYRFWFENFVMLNPRLKEVKPGTFSKYHLAGFFGIDPLVEQLLRKSRASIPMTFINPMFQKDNTGETPVSYAAERTDPQTLQLFVKKNRGVVYFRAGDGTSPFVSAVIRGKIAAVKVLMEGGAKINERHGSATPLHYAATYDYLEIAKLLLSRTDIEADSKDEDSRAPLSYAAEYGSSEIAKLLLSRAEVEAGSKDIWGKPPLIYAAANGSLEIVKPLLSRTDVKVNSKDTQGRTALYYAAAYGSVETVKLLLSRTEVKADSKDRLGQTPLSVAAANGSLEVVKLLLSRTEVKADLKDIRGRTALSYAAAYGSVETVKLLLSRTEVKADSKDFRGRTPLSYAAAYGSLEIVKLLLSRTEVEANSKDTWNRTPLSYALEKGEKKVIRLLKSHIAK